MPAIAEYTPVLATILTKEVRNFSAFDSTRTPKLEARDRLEHGLLNASRSLGGIVKEATAADRKALSNRASAPLKHLKLRNPGSSNAVFIPQDLPENQRIATEFLESDFGIYFSRETQIESFSQESIFVERSYSTGLGLSEGV